MAVCAPARRGYVAAFRIRMPAPLGSYESSAADAVGEVMAAWGFKRNHGRIWAVLYLRDVALSASDIRALLGLSKGAASMLLTDLQTWKVVVPGSRGPAGEGCWAAETDFLGMIERVLAAREADTVRRARVALEAAMAQTPEDADPAVQLRLTMMLALATLTEETLGTLLRERRVDLNPVVELLRLGR